MPKEEKAYWAEKDPVKLFEQVLRNKRILTDKQVEELKKETGRQINDSIDYASSSPESEIGDVFDDLYVSMEVPR
jgi:pyruvate dehydrogenase E1 component alpha subunit